MTIFHNQIKDSIYKGLKEVLQPNILPHHNSLKTNSDFGDVFLSSNLEMEKKISKNLVKCVKPLVETALLHQIEDQLIENKDTSKETCKITVHNLSKIMLPVYHSKVLCLQDNLTNVLDTCLNELHNSNIKCIIDSELDISPLLQPDHLIEIIECMSADKPIDVRLNALQILFKSHFSDTVNGDNWLLLQKKLVENLFEGDIEIFLTCLKVHRKLASSSSPGALKECTLNLLDSLSQHYNQQNNKTKSLSFQGVHFYRMVHITSLILDCFHEATKNLARIGEVRLEKMIDGFVQVLAVSIPSKQLKNKNFLYPLEILSFLQPNGHWVVNITHFKMSRNIFFSSLYKNSNFLNAIVEDIVNWLSEPILPPRNLPNVTQGELNCVISKYSMFCHSLSVFATICSFSICQTLFPINLKKKDDFLSVEDICKIIVLLLNESRFNEMISKTTKEFKHSIALNISRMLCFKNVNGCYLLLMLLKTNNSQEFVANTVKVKILDYISQSISCKNIFLTDEIPKRNRSYIFSHCFVEKTNFVSNQNYKNKLNLEYQASMPFKLDQEICDACPFQVYLKVIKDLSSKDLRSNPCLIKIVTRVMKSFNGVLGLNVIFKTQVIKHLAEIYIALQDILRLQEYKFDNGESILSNALAEFFLQVAVTPLGFFMLKELRVVSPLLIDKLQQPLTEWSDPTWLSFISKSASTLEGCEIIAGNSGDILRKELNLLWSVMEEDCSGSDLPIEEMSFQLLTIISCLGSNLYGTRALLSESRSGSGMTILEELERPTSLSFLLEHFALSYVNCPDFTYHQFALTVLEIFVSNLDSNIYLQIKFQLQDILLEIQSCNRVDEHSDVVIDECSLLRHKIIKQTFIPGRYQADSKPTHLPPRPESTLARAKPRSRGSSELTRWLNETREGLHDQNWLKHAREIYRNFSLDDLRGSTLQDLLEQVVKTLPESRIPITWLNVGTVDNQLKPEEQLAVQLVVRYGIQHRLIQSTQQNIKNLTQLIIISRGILKPTTCNFDGFDWFVASAYLICSGNVEKTQAFLSFASTLPTAPLMWPFFGGSLYLAQIGSVLDTIIAEEMPNVYQSLKNVGLSWWHFCQTWISQCWWNTLEWPQICQWFSLSILHQSDHLIYFCVALLYANKDRILKMANQGTPHELIKLPFLKFHINDERVIIEKLHKKYHIALHPFLAL